MKRKIQDELLADGTKRQKSSSKKRQRSEPKNDEDAPAAKKHDGFVTDDEDADDEDAPSAKVLFFFRKFPTFIGCRVLILSF